ncbi:MAG: hypothetical protein QMD71_01635 [bacterium]|nr:hypothetical protein [bacterium]
MIKIGVLILIVSGVYLGILNYLERLMVKNVLGCDINEAIAVTKADLRNMDLRNERG